MMVRLGRLKDGGAVRGITEANRGAYALPLWPSRTAKLGLHKTSASRMLTCLV